MYCPASSGRSISTQGAAAVRLTFGPFPTGVVVRHVVVCAVDVSPVPGNEEPITFEARGFAKPPLSDAEYWFGRSVYQHHQHGIQPPAATRMNIPTQPVLSGANMLNNMAPVRLPCHWVATESEQFLSIRLAPSNGNTDYMMTAFIELA